MKEKIILLIFILLATSAPEATAQEPATRIRIYGHITDKSNGEALPYVSVRINKTTYGSSSDNYGNFSFFVPRLRDTLIISCIGYKEERIPLNGRTRFPLNIKMSVENYHLSEVTIRPKKEKYSRKNNPAVTLAPSSTDATTIPPKTNPFTAATDTKSSTLPSTTSTRLNSSTLASSSHSSNNTSTHRLYRESPSCIFRHASLSEPTTTAKSPSVNANT